MLLHHAKLLFTNHVDGFLNFFDPPPPNVDHFSKILTPPLSVAVHMVCERPKTRKSRVLGKFNITSIFYILNFPAPFSAGFPYSQDKTAGISEIFLLFFTLFLYIAWCRRTILFEPISKLCAICHDENMQAVTSLYYLEQSESNYVRFIFCYNLSIHALVLLSLLFSPLIQRIKRAY